MSCGLCSARFPLTLTLSLGEREQRAGVAVSSNVRPANTALCVATSLRIGLPLPEGEGRGEVKRNLIQHLAVGSLPRLLPSAGADQFAVQSNTVTSRSL